MNGPKLDMTRCEREFDETAISLLRKKKCWKESLETQLGSARRCISKNQEDGVPLLRPTLFTC